ncbi:uncharacterized protein SOCE836_047060 [Sorangium cellulosum]|uniref:Uncharacterized protein n=1 Tax=Sorangium cellulosum TaxID=56 RepID=A0A4P2QSK7_SORCE|nr:uncharacterized protein SOCE836_047060 [Sorangium cellulosum]WCQ91939.1 hypothetical protein NQZ70_04666 [Sorangium sp. Soce836]
MEATLSAAHSRVAPMASTQALIWLSVGSGAGCSFVPAFSMPWRHWSQENSTQASTRASASAEPTHAGHAAAASHRAVSICRQASMPTASVPQLCVARVTAPRPSNPAAAHVAELRLAAERTASADEPTRRSYHAGAGGVEFSADHRLAVLPARPLRRRRPHAGARPWCNRAGAAVVPGRARAGAALSRIGRRAPATSPASR